MAEGLERSESAHATSHSYISDEPITYRDEPITYRSEVRSPLPGRQEPSWAMTSSPRPSAPFETQTTIHRIPITGFPAKHARVVCFHRRAALPTPPFKKKKRLPCMKTQNESSCPVCLHLVQSRSKIHLNLNHYSTVQPLRHSLKRREVAKSNAPFNLAGV